MSGLISYSRGVIALKPSTTIDAPCEVCALGSSPDQCHVHNAEQCLGNRPQEASDELLDIRVVTGADCGAEPDVQQAAQEEAEAAAEARGATSRRNKRLRRKKNGILQLQEVQAATDAAEEAAWAALLEEEDDAGAAWEQEESSLQSIDCRRPARSIPRQHEAQCVLAAYILYSYSSLAPVRVGAS